MEKGVSFIEIIVVITIFLILVLVGVIFSGGRQLGKGRDAQRKSDLEKIRTVFEDYFNDNNCYPDGSVLNTCGSQVLRPYLQYVPCDPLTKAPYQLQAGADAGDCNIWFKVYCLLETDDDPVISKLGLGHGERINGNEINYGVASGNVSVGET